jgi:peptidoglycan/LPS O-acetylase OafA/YrhL
MQDVQALRGLSIILVLFEHLVATNTLVRNLGVTPPFYSGVDLFFVVSGFVVPASLERGRWNAAAFLVRRMFRLWPVLLVALALALFVNWLFMVLPSSHLGRSF